MDYRILTIATGVAVAGAAVIAKPAVTSMQQLASAAIFGCGMDSKGTALAASADQLQQLVRCARGGETIRLAPGTYSDVWLTNIKPASTVTITSADKNNPAIFTGLSIVASSHLAVTDLEFVAPAGSGNAYPFQVLNSSSITLKRLNVHGPLPGASTISTGLLIRDSKDVAVENSEVHGLMHGICVMGSSRIAIANNSLHGMQSDGVRGTANLGILVSGNVITNFHPVHGDHPDAIQFWTTNTTTSSEDITVTKNVIVRGDGAAVQGIFLNEEVQTLPYKNVTITDNILVGTLYNGIMVVNGRNVVLRSNTVLPLPDQRSWIRLFKNEGVTVEDNRATELMVDPATRTDPNRVGPVRKGEIDQAIEAQRHRSAGRNSQAAAQ